MVKDLPCSPGRTCLKRTGDPIFIRTRIPMKIRRGDKIITEGTTIARSKKHLIEFLCVLQKDMFLIYFSSLRLCLPCAIRLRQRSVFHRGVRPIICGYPSPLSVLAPLRETVNLCNPQMLFATQPSVYWPSRYDQTVFSPDERLIVLPSLPDQYWKENHATF